MSIIIPANTLASGDFEVDNSCRFDDGSSAYMHITPDSDGSRVAWTFSTWIKRCALGAMPIFSTPGNTSNIYDEFYFNASDKIQFSAVVSGTQYALRTKRVFRDTSAWYHIVLIFDSNNSTAGDRMQLWINGVRTAEGDFEDITFKDAQNYNSSTNKSGYIIYLGRVTTNTAGYYDGYMSEVVFQNAAVDSPVDKFGEFDEDSGIWKPIDVSGLTFGTNGFYLDFKASGNLGNDANGGTDLTEVNLAATDQTTDTCTNNFATMNSLDNFHQATAFTEGNCKLVYTSGNRTWNTASVALSSGKWYVEILKGATEHDTIGIHYKLSAALTDRPDSDAGAWSYLGGKEYDDGGVKENGSTINYAVAPSDSGDIVGMYLDLDNNKLYFAVNGAIGKINASDSGHTGIAIPAASTLENGHYYIFGGSDNASATMTHSWNFGNPIVALSSAVSDANGFGSFEYTPSGTFDGASKDFLAICTKNLAEYG